MESKLTSKIVQAVDFETFHLLHPAAKSGALHVRLVADISDPYALARGEQRPVGTLLFKRMSGSKTCDLVGTDRPPLRLFSARALAVLKNIGATGWDSSQVRVIGKAGDVIDEYHLLIISGRAGAIQNDRSSRLWKMPPLGGNPHEIWRGMLFDETSWDGSDVFCLGQTTHVVVTARVQKAFERERLTNVEFTRLVDVERLSSEL